MHIENVPLFGEIKWNSSELAQALLLTPQRVNQLAKEHVLPPAVDGLFRPIEAVGSYIRFLRERETGKSKNGEEVRKLQLENEMRQIRLQRIAGELVPVSRVKADWFDAGRRVRDGLLNLPSRLSGPFAAESKQEKIFEVFTKEIYVVLDELASAPTAGQEVSGAPVGEVSTAPVGEVSEPGQSRDETAALDQVCTSQPAASTFDEAFLDSDRGADDPDDRFSTGD